MIGTLQRENDRILALCERLATAQAGATGPGPISMGPVRDEIAAMLIDHMRFKGALIYSPLRAVVPEDGRAVVDEMDALGQQLYADYVKHRNDWTHDRIMADWAVYKAGTLDLIDRLRHVILLERLHIYPLL